MLLEDFSSPCVIMEKKRTSDDAGGWITTWEEGEKFENYFSQNSSTEAVIAERQGISAIYDALVEKNVPVEYGDFFKDLSSGKTYRITSNPEAKQAPKSSSFDLKYFTAERKELPQ